jgi:hypothetical protein
MALKPINKTKAGIRTNHFSNVVILLREVLNLEMVHLDKEGNFAKFKLPSGEILEVFGSKNIWHPFTTPPDWEVIIADIHSIKDKK